MGDHVHASTSKEVHGKLVQGDFVAGDFGAIFMAAKERLESNSPHARSGRSVQALEQDRQGVWEWGEWRSVMDRGMMGRRTPCGLPMETTCRLLTCCYVLLTCGCELLTCGLPMETNKYPPPHMTHTYPPPRLPLETTCSMIRPGRGTRRCVAMCC
jgi:hypothetical protein